MKITINRFEGFHTNRAGLSLLVGTTNFSVDSLSLRQKGRLMIEEYQIFCCVTGKRKNSDSFSIHLQIDNNLRNIKAINPYIYRKDLSFLLLIQENVERSIYAESQNLLQQLSNKTGRDAADLLCELTKFMHVPGKRDLRFVSQKQMVVLIDKIKKELAGGNSDIEARTCSVGQIDV